MWIYVVTTTDKWMHWRKKCNASLWNVVYKKKKYSLNTELVRGFGLLLNCLRDAPPPCRSQRCTCSSSSLSLQSWDSSCLLWSSRICMRVSRRVLCCRRTRASARSSSSCCPPSEGEPVPSSPASVSMGTAAVSSCFHLSLLYSLCSTLRTHSGGRMEGQQSEYQTHKHKGIDPASTKGIRYCWYCTTWRAIIIALCISWNKSYLPSPTYGLLSVYWLWAALWSLTAKLHVSQCRYAQISSPVGQPLNLFANSITFKLSVVPQTHVVCVIIIAKLTHLYSFK